MLKPESLLTRTGKVDRCVPNGVAHLNRGGLMRLLCACLALPLLAGSLVAGGAKAEWVKVSPKGSNCEILFPAKPTEKEGAGFLLERDGGKAALILQNKALPEAVDIGNAGLVKLVFDGGRDQMMKNLKGAKIVSEKDLKFDKRYPARDIDVEVPGQGLFRIRAILTGSRMYVIMVAGSREYQNGAEAKKFRASFKLKG
jgi:hypothetical protein